MSYSKQTWDANSYVNPSRMNHIEDGIYAAANVADSAVSAAATAATSSGTSFGNTNVGDILAYHTGITPSSSGKSTLLEYIQDVVIPKGGFIYGFGASSFSDLPTDWGYDVVVFRIGGVFVLAERQLSEGELYIRNIGANSQWVGSWRQL